MSQVTSLWTGSSSQRCWHLCDIVDHTLLMQIAEQFDWSTSTFNLTNKISHIVTDNAANMLKAFPPYSRRQAPSTAPSLCRPWRTLLKKGYHNKIFRQVSCWIHTWKWTGATQSESLILKVVILRKAQHMAPVPQSTPTDEQKPIVEWLFRSEGR